MKKFNNIFLGFSISFILSIIFILIFSIILEKTNFNESYIDAIIIVISSVSILIGTTIATKKCKKYGILTGGIVAIMYMIFMYIISSIIICDFYVGSKSVLMFFRAVVLGCIGGIIGINIKS